MLSSPGALASRWLSMSNGLYVGSALGGWRSMDADGERNWSGGVGNAPHTEAQTPPMSRPHSRAWEMPPAGRGAGHLACSWGP